MPGGLTITRIRALGAAATIIAIVTAACSGGSSGGPGRSAGPTDAAVACAAGTTKIEVQSWWTTDGEATALRKLFDQFNKDNPTLCAYNAAIAGGAGAAAQAVVKTRTLAGQPPDTFQVHMGHELLDAYVDISAGSVLAPLDTTIIDPSAFPTAVDSIISGSDGKVYSVPLDIHRANELWYNKKVFADFGLKPPKTWADFKTVADALTAKGITPLALGDNGIWAFGIVFETILIAELGVDGFNGLWTGATPWTDRKVTDALNQLKTVSGYVNGDHSSLTWDQANQRVIDGKAGMTIMGDWANADYVVKKFSDYGWTPAPGNTGIYQALADSFPLPAKAPHPDAVKQLLAFMASARGQDTFNPPKGSIPARIDAGIPPAGSQQYNAYQHSAMSDWIRDKIVPSMELGAAAAPAWRSAIEAALTTFEADGDVVAMQQALVAAGQAAGN
jgi:glucose/mannose transport system substrate-binding protein